MYKDLEGNNYLVEQWWTYHTNSTDKITPTWKGKTDLLPSSSTVYLQIYNFDTSVDTYYFDASDAGPTDAGSDWYSDANAFDGSTASHAGIAGDYGQGTLTGEGTNAPASGDSITQVRARFHAYTMGAGTINGVYWREDTASTGTLLGSDTSWYSFFPSAWSSYTTLTAPSGGWTWAKIQALAVDFDAENGDATNAEIYCSEIEVTSGGGWETLDSDSTTAIDTEFTLTGEQATDLSNYYDTGNKVALRVYQEVV